MIISFFFFNKDIYIEILKNEQKACFDWIQIEQQREEKDEKKLFQCEANVVPSLPFSYLPN